MRRDQKGPEQKIPITDFNSRACVRRDWGRKQTKGYDINFNSRACVRRDMAEDKEITEIIKISIHAPV